MITAVVVPLLEMQNVFIGWSSMLL